MYKNDTNTAILECLDIVRKEYDYERNKQQSFENRSLIIVTFLCAMFAILFGRVKIIDVINYVTIPLTFYSMIRVVAGIIAYLGGIISLWLITQTIGVRKQCCYNVGALNEERLGTERVQMIVEQILVFERLVDELKEANNHKAITYSRALRTMLLTFFASVIYLSM